MEAKQYEPIGRRIKALRITFSLTQSDFADKCGINRGYLASLEVGNKKPSSNIISLLIDATNVNSNWLLTGEGAMFMDVASELVVPLPTKEPSESDIVLRNILLMLEGLPEDKLKEIQSFVRDKKFIEDLMKERAG